MAISFLETNLYYYVLAIGMILAQFGVSRVFLKCRRTTVSSPINGSLPFFVLRCSHFRIFLNPAADFKG